MQFKEIPQKRHDEWGSFPEHLSEVPVSVCPPGGRWGSCKQVSAVKGASSASLTRLLSHTVPSHGSHHHNKVSLKAVAPSGLKFGLCCAGAVGVSLLTLSLEGSPPNVGGCIISESLWQKTL